MGWKMGGCEKNLILTRSVSAGGPHSRFLHLAKLQFTYLSTLQQIRTVLGLASSSEP